MRERRPRMIRNLPGFVGAALLVAAIALVALWQANAKRLPVETQPSLIASGIPSPQPSPPAASVQSALTRRLEQRGVPVTALNILSTSPLEIEIVIVSTSQTQKDTPDDMWHEILAEHEAAIAYRYGPPVDIVNVKVVNGSGEVVSDGLRNYSGLPSQSRPVPPPSKISDTETAAHFEDAIRPNGLRVRQVQVNSYDLDSKDGQIVQVGLEASGPDKANAHLRDLDWWLRYGMARVNHDAGADMVMGRLIVVDPAGNVLVQFFEDHQGGAQGAKFTDSVKPPASPGKLFPSSPRDLFMSPLPTDIAPTPFVPPATPTRS